MTTEFLVLVIDSVLNDLSTISGDWRVSNAVLATKTNFLCGIKS